MEQLVNDMNYKYVCTRRFTQDCVENLFSVIRRDKGGFNSHPEASKAIQALRFICCEKLIQSSKLANCEEDGDCILLKIGK